MREREREKIQILGPFLETENLAIKRVSRFLKPNVEH